MSKSNPEGVPANLSEEARERQEREQAAARSSTPAMITREGVMGSPKEGVVTTEVETTTPTPEEQEAKLREVSERNEQALRGDNP